MRPIIAIALLVLCVHSVELQAQVYKCKEADGTLTYSQTPCSKEKPVIVQATESNDNSVDCSYADKFAVSTARMMRSGLASDEVFNRYGGLDALSRGSIGVINYVYSFRTNIDVTPERIAGLTQAKCKARGFGDVSCDDLPDSFTEGLGGCDADENGETSPSVSTIESTVALGQEQSAVTASTGRVSRPPTGTTGKELTEQCKKKYRDEIDAIDAKMRSGYSSQQGERYREQLRALTEKLRAC